MPQASAHERAPGLEIDGLERILGSKVSRRATAVLSFTAYLLGVIGAVIAHNTNDSLHYGLVSHSR